MPTKCLNFENNLIKYWYSLDVISGRREADKKNWKCELGRAWKHGLFFNEK